jgi:hypothetical protein
MRRRLGSRRTAQAQCGLAAQAAAAAHGVVQLTACQGLHGGGGVGAF